MGGRALAGRERRSVPLRDRAGRQPRGAREQFCLTRVSLPRGTVVPEAFQIPTAEPRARLRDVRRFSRFNGTSRSSDFSVPPDGDRAYDIYGAGVEGGNALRTATQTPAEVLRGAADEGRHRDARGPRGRPLRVIAFHLWRGLLLTAALQGRTPIQGRRPIQARTPRPREGSS